ncbi:L,D-transpeptidase [Aureimonas jatrophae]|uniref:L,D-transpeptidase catalytic domain n=1 Tax=Aureimonas jatrophae TaxID=1166073 RepID=A0A1H0NLP5_9HYPH|nr:L,D-transpeptidase [Aureimonas jatrophae]SDO93468.1 L,D-transpeptidase catalytic domain [Aureimonas jatrophae]
MLVGSLILTGCSTAGPSVVAPRDSSPRDRDAIAQSAPSRVPPRFRRQSVTYPSAYAPGTLVVDSTNRFLYLIEPNGRALRYGVGIGIGGFAWSGEGTIERKQAWPRWTPPAEMVARAPQLSRYQGGMAGGGINPLGARALYVYQNGHDTLYRLHGTSEWWTIGQSGSSGCIRLLNADVIDLYERVQLRARIVVLPQASRVRSRLG